MRIGAVWVPSSNANYRALDPLNALARRGHEIVWPPEGGAADPRRLAGCDVVHVYRRADTPTREALSRLVARGTALVYDNDDDLRAIPKESPDYKRYGGPMAKRLWAMSVQLARLARVVTTTTDALAETYRRAGAQRVAVIPNHLAPGIDRTRRGHDGIVIGWIGGIDHRADTARIPISEALARVVAEHDDVRVESVGVKLDLAEHYTHTPYAPFTELPRHIGGYDIGIAPLADIPANLVRSDIKLKEYSASGVPWLASPVGPYRGLGEAQGGRLVADDGWYEALTRLVTQHREREQLADAARAWAAAHMIDAVVGRWEQVLADAAGLQIGDGRFALKPGVTVRLRVPQR